MWINLLNCICSRNYSYITINVIAENYGKMQMMRPQLLLQYNCRGHHNNNITAVIAIANCNCGCILQFKTIQEWTPLSVKNLLNSISLFHLFIIFSQERVPLTTEISDLILVGSWLSRNSARFPVINSDRTTPNANTSVFMVTWSTFTDLEGRKEGKCQKQK